MYSRQEYLMEIKNYLNNIPMMFMDGETIRLDTLYDLVSCEKEDQ